MAAEGITVILTARNEKNGTEAVEKLKESGFSDVVFHPLDVKDPASIATLAKFVETHYKKLDILVNNAGENGYTPNFEKLAPLMKDGAGVEMLVDDANAHLLEGAVIETPEMAVECLKTNYYGTARVTEALLPLLLLSKSPRIVNVTSVLGQLMFIKSEEVKAELSNVENLTKEKIDNIVERFLKDFKDGKLRDNSWPLTVSGYKVSKAAVNAYTKFMAKTYPNILINCVHPGYVKTDINYGGGDITPEEGARGPAKLALLPDGGPSGRYFNETQEADY